MAREVGMVGVGVEVVGRGGRQGAPINAPYLQASTRKARLHIRVDPRVIAAL